MSRATIEPKKATLRGSKFVVTKRERQVLDMLTKEFLTPAKISQRRGTSKQTTYKIIQALRRKGLFNAKNLRATEYGCSFRPVAPAFPVEQVPLKGGVFVRLHGEEYNLGIIRGGRVYDRAFKLGNSVLLDGNRVRFFRRSLEVYSGQEFEGGSVREVGGLALAYWERFFTRLENEYGIVLVKARVHNIRLVKSHWAEVNNEVARELRVSREKLHVYAREDGKLAFLVDFSLGRDEFEAVHPDTAQADFERVREHFLDVRDNPHYSMSYLSGVLGRTVVVVQDIALGLKSVNEVLLALLPKNASKSEDCDDKGLSDYIG